jgi:2-polyprenyl-3-methyl-5-hydroxy-6-metoxy-1,4-benzoquinol methylase
MLKPFSKRSTELELLDGENLPVESLHKNLKELDWVNSLLGGNNISIKGVSRLLRNYPKNKTYYIVDIGCGSGDILCQLAKWAKKTNYQLKLTGIDINPTIAAYAQAHCTTYPEINILCGDYQVLINTQIEKVDIFICSLFCHHLTDESLVEYLKFTQSHAQIGTVINDLHRNWLAWASIWFITRVLPVSYLMKNDAPLSVKRAFVKKEWINFLQQAGISIANYQINWQWAFRYLITTTSK